MVFFVFSWTPLQPSALVDTDDRPSLDRVPSCHCMLGSVRQTPSDPFSGQVATTSTLAQSCSPPLTGCGLEVAVSLRVPAGPRAVDAGCSGTNAVLAQCEEEGKGDGPHSQSPRSVPMSGHWIAERHIPPEHTLACRLPAWRLPCG